eukprot:1025878-Rhodomonas_salina.4
MRGTIWGGCNFARVCMATSGRRFASSARVGSMRQLIEMSRHQKQTIVVVTSAAKPKQTSEIAIAAMAK